MDIYEIARGPLAWIACILFVIGSVYRLATLMIETRRERVLRPYMSVKHGLRSIVRWVVPFGTLAMRKNPVTTIVSFSFHVCVIVTPVLLLGHTVLLYESWSIHWWSMPDTVADRMTLVVIITGLSLLARRILLPHVRAMTSPSDVSLLAITLLPFLTGYIAYHQWFAYRPILILHVLSGEILMVAIPFTRLGHMLLFFLTRAYAGSDIVRARST